MSCKIIGAAADELDVDSSVVPLVGAPFTGPLVATCGAVTVASWARAGSVVRCLSALFFCVSVLFSHA